MGFRNAVKKKAIHTGREGYVNPLTGETLQSEIPNVSSVNVVDENFCIVDSAEYVVIDDSAMRYLREVLPPQDVAKVYQMTEMCRGMYNLLYKDEINPHTRETLKVDLGIAHTTFSQLLSKLEKLGVIAYIIAWRDRRKYKYIMLNPTLARRGKRFYAECKKVFEDLSGRL